ncbi:hypothetical protein AB0L56_27655 [Streptomyces sp. NPDC052079]|uniref:hypothetical protein n=1 Tax=Streptomyces sp. NPDC052079 TaxID=3155526 RepID=UPI003439BE05
MRPAPGPPTARNATLGEVARRLGQRHDGTTQCEEFAFEVWTRRTTCLASGGNTPISTWSVAASNTTA